MPRYCAVKVCRNRGGTPSRQDNKRISFYPFPLQDKSRLQKWVDNMRREDWTPSRHQYLCSEHFREDCFDIRWGIRYLKNTAIPTIFPPTEDDGDKNATANKRNLTSKPNPSESDINASEFPLGKRPLVLGRASKQITLNTASSAETGKVMLELPRESSCVANRLEQQAPICETVDDSGIQTASTPCIEQQAEGQKDSSVYCESLETFSDSEAALGPAFSLFPMEVIADQSMDCFVEDEGPFEGEHISVYEHSYCRPDTNKDQLWSKILSLHSKILELDRREENTVAKIHALENEITNLKRDGAVFKEKQKVLEDFISSVLM